MKNYKLTIEYDGTHFLGFQIQTKGRTLQLEIEKSLQKLFRQKIRILSCGRTDTGVHAKGHVINFKVDTKIENKNIQNALNRYLPRDIAVKSIRKVPLKFHAQYDAKSKIYEYRILQETYRSPLQSRYSHRVASPLNVEKMRMALKFLEGKHDFRSFASKTEQEKNTIRNMIQAKLMKRKSLIIIRLEANGFLYNMVRNIVGTLLLVGTEKMSVAEFKNVFKACNRKLAGPVAPPEGLTLVKVRY